MTFKEKFLQITQIRNDTDNGFHAPQFNPDPARTTTRTEKIQTLGTSIHDNEAPLLSLLNMNVRIKKCHKCITFSMLLTGDSLERKK